MNNNQHKKQTLFGLLNIAKPSGPTSHDIVAVVRRGTGERRIGHAGTLDPLAAGVLVLALGPATRLVEYLMGSTKTYEAQITLGITTDTYDAEGRVTAQHPLPAGLTEPQIEAALEHFRGEIEQVPPVYSAVKINGKSAHARVRSGEEVTLKPRTVVIHTCQMTEFEPPRIGLRVVCSPGTYIRSLAHDLGQKLGCGAMLSGLTRTASGQFKLSQAVEWEALLAAFDDGSWQRYLIPADQALSGSPRIVLDEAGAADLQHGRPIAADQVEPVIGRAYLPGGQFAGVLSGDPERQVWQPRKVFAHVFET